MDWNGRNNANNLFSGLYTCSVIYVHLTTTATACTHTINKLKIKLLERSIWHPRKNTLLCECGLSAETILTKCNSILQRMF